MGHALAREHERLNLVERQISEIEDDSYPLHRSNSEIAMDHAPDRYRYVFECPSLARRASAGPIMAERPRFSDHGLHQACV